jgi:DNA-binding GntR family transcriptional regulator
MASQWDRAYQDLRAAIVERKILPGTKLIERTISDELGVSRSTIRAVMHYLAAEGLVQLVQGKGASVAQLSPQDTLKVLDVRAVLEGMAARLATELQSTDLIQELSKEISNMEQALSLQEFIKYSEYAAQFHQLIIEAADNEFLHAAHEASRVALIQYGANILLTGHVEEMFGGHKIILEAIKNGLPDEAEKSARNHIQVIKKAFRALHDL